LVALIGFGNALNPANPTNLFNLANRQVYS
jgi:hypothetical protein